MTQAISVTPKRYTCSHCGASFEALRRASYCSAACKQSAYRNRNNHTVTLHSELQSLIDKYQHLLKGKDGWVDDVTYPGYRQRSLHEDVTSRKYRDLAYCLTGHATNDGCKGIFSHLHDHEVEPMLMLMLMELVEGLDRPHGGSVHQADRALD